MFANKFFVSRSDFREVNPVVRLVQSSGSVGSLRSNGFASIFFRIEFGTVWFVFATQTLVSCWKRALLVTKGFYSPNDTQSREKTAKTAVFRHRWQAWKVVQSIEAVRQRPRTPRNWRFSFTFFESFLSQSIKYNVQRWSSDFQGLFCVNIRMAQEAMISPCSP